MILQKVCGFLFWKKGHRVVSFFLWYCQFPPWSEWQEGKLGFLSLWGNEGTHNAKQVNNEIPPLSEYQTLDNVWIIKLFMVDNITILEILFHASFNLWSLLLLFFCNSFLFWLLDNRSKKPNIVWIVQIIKMPFLYLKE